jgi:hypothetical protein
MMAAKESIVNDRDEIVNIVGEEADLGDNDNEI